MNQVENYESTEKHFHRDYFHRGETIFFEHKPSCIGPKPTKAKTLKIYRQKLYLAYLIKKMTRTGSMKSVIV